MKAKTNKELSLHIVDHINQGGLMGMSVKDCAKMSGDIHQILDREMAKSSRRTGRSTRQIDEAIQSLFTTGFILVIDHHEHGTHSKANEQLFDRVLNRLYVEHSEVYDKARIDKDRLLIVLK